VRIDARQLLEPYGVVVIQQQNPLIFPCGNGLPSGHQFAASHTQLRIDRFGSNRQSLAIRDQGLLDLLGIQVKRAAPEQAFDGFIS